MHRFALPLALVVALVLGGCAPSAPSGSGGSASRLEPGFDSKSAGIRLVNGVIEAQFCDDYPASTLALGEYDADVLPYFDLKLYSLQATALPAGQVFVFSNQYVSAIKTPSFEVGNEIEVLILPQGSANTDMVASRFLIEEPGLPSELWLRPDGLLLVDPCA